MLKDEKTYLNYLKGFAALFVVLDHTIGTCSEIYDVSSSWNTYMQMLAKAIHVPLFLLVAGYLCHEKPFLTFIKGKIQRIIVPFWFFSALKVVFSLFVVKNYMHGSSLWDTFFDAFVIGRTYWFAYSIFFMYLFTALVFWRVKGVQKKTRWYFGCFVVLTVVNTVLGIMEINFPESITFGTVVINNPFFQIEYSLKYFPYFIAGLIIQNNEKKIACILKNQRIYIICFSFVITISGICLISVSSITKYPFWLKLVMSFPLMVILYYIARILPKNLNMLSEIGKCSYQIMLFDGMTRIVLCMLCAKLFAMNTITVLILAVVNVIINVIMCRVIKKIPIVSTVFGL